MRSVLLCIILVVSLPQPAHCQQPKSITNSIGMKLVLIHAGSFTMGSPESEIGRQENETPHEVTISKSYYLGIYEVTQEQYKKVMGNNPSQFKGTKNPVENVSWDDAVSFCNRLLELPEEKESGREYRLPTDEEWEYACRATSPSAYCFGDASDSLDEYAWFGESEKSKTHAVGGKKPNRWGLFDMHGNVWEWCSDIYVPYSLIAVEDPQMAYQDTSRNQDTSRVLHGGCWGSSPAYCRSAIRNGKKNSESFSLVGFRVAMSLPAKQPEAASSK